VFRFNSTFFVCTEPRPIRFATNLGQIDHILAKKRDKIDEPRPSNPENTIYFRCNFSTTDLTAEALSTLIAHARLTSHFIERINRYRTKWN